MFAMLAAVVSVLVFGTPVKAQEETLFSEYTYIMGERDTILDAKKISFVEAKRLLAEKAGTYLESTSEVSEGTLTRDDIQTYALASLRVEIVEQSVRPRGEQMAAYTKVKGYVNSKSMPEDVAAIKKDRALKASLDRQRAELDETHNQVEQLNEKIKKLEAMNASDQEIRWTSAKREAALDNNIIKGMSMFCSLACSTAKLKDTRFVQTMFRNAGMAPMLSVLMGPDQCSDLCTEAQQAIACSLLGR